MKPASSTEAKVRDDEAPHLPGIQRWSTVYAIVLLALVIYIIGLVALTRSFS